MNIVIIEDEALTALFLEESLNALNYNIVGVFDNGKSLLSFLKDGNSVDLIFMDINIKGTIDGLELSQMVYKSYSNTKFVFVTSYQDNKTISQARLVKPLGYLIKPIIQSDIDALMMVVDGLIKTDENVEQNKLYLIEGFIWDYDFNGLYHNKKIIDLTKNEKELLMLLVSYPNRVFSYEVIENVLFDNTSDNKRLVNIVSRLKVKLNYPLVEAIYGQGYRLKLK